MVRSKLLIILVFTLFITSCSTSPTGRGQLILKSNAELEAQARSTFNAYRATLPLTTDRAKIDFVSCVAGDVVAELDPPYSDFEWELAIFEQNQVNAFAMPGGKIGVYTGILDVTENEHQLAAVIGHEIAHVTAKHVNERASRGTLTQIGIEALAIIMGGGYTGGAYTAQQVMSAGAALGMELPMGRARNRRRTLSVSSTWPKRVLIHVRPSICGRTWRRWVARSHQSICRLTLQVKPESKILFRNGKKRFLSTIRLWQTARTRPVKRLGGDGQA